MTDYLHIQLPPDQIRGISSIGLAHMGDAVYELLVRTWLCAHGKATGKGLHRATVALVCAPKQAELAQRILPLLTEEEQAVFRRGRNANVHSIPAHASRAQYQQATAGMLGQAPKDTGLPTAVIVDGKLKSETLSRFRLTPKKVDSILKKQKLSVEDVFIMQVDNQSQTIICKQGEEPER